MDDDDDDEGGVDGVPLLKPAVTAATSAFACEKNRPSGCFFPCEEAAEQEGKETDEESGEGAGARAEGGALTAPGGRR